MRGIFILSLFVLVLQFEVLAQPGWNLRENAQWKFYYYAGLNFNHTPPAADTSAMGPYTWSFNYNPTNGDEPMGASPAAVSDINGNLLFYTGAAKVYDRNHNVMPNGNDIWGSNSFRSSFILPSMTNFKQYYLVYLSGGVGLPIFGNGLASPTDFRLRYSLIDMSLNNGLGDVVASEKNIIIAENLAGMLAVSPGNDCNIWIVGHARDSAQFKSYEFTGSGFNPLPVISNSGVLQPFPSLVELSYFGMMEISPDRTHLAMIDFIGLVPQFGTGYVITTELFDFNANSGTVSNAIIVDTPSLYPNFGLLSGLCFSPDNSKLYSTSYTYGDTYRHLAQFDLSLGSAAAIRNSKISIVDSIADQTTPRLGPDGKVYILTQSDLFNVIPTYLGCIHNPNQPGPASNFQRLAIPLLTNTGSEYAGDLGSGFIKPYPADTSHVTHNLSLCSYMDTLILQPPVAGYFYKWANGDTAARKIIATPGTYWVINGDYCHYRVDTFVVKYINIDFQLQDTLICNESSITIRVPLDGAQYLWQDGSVYQQYFVDTSGLYWVKVIKEGCTVLDTVKVIIKDLRQHLSDKDEMVFCKGEEIHVPLTANALPGSTIEWSTGSTQPAIIAERPGTYTVRVTDTPCVGSGSIVISVDPYCDCILNMPTAFSPNNDGLNDVLLPVTSGGCPIYNYTLNIYNRYGQNIYSSKDVTQGWDGRQNGAVADVGTYFYEIRFEGGTRAKQFYRKGDIVLIR